jgi:hypothetical protein
MESTMAKHCRWIFAISLVHISAFAWAGSIVDMPIGDAGKVRYRVHSHTALQGSGVSISELIYGSKKIVANANLSFTTARGIGQSGDSLLYGPGGEILIRGYVGRDGRRPHGSNRDAFQGVLMRGTFLNAKLVDDDGKLMLVAKLVERLNPALAAMLGVPVQSEGTLELLLSDSRYCGVAVDKVIGGSLNLLSEPSSLSTLSSSLLVFFLAFGAGVVNRRDDAGVVL